MDNLLNKLKQAVQGIGMNFNQTLANVTQPVRNLAQSGGLVNAIAPKTTANVSNFLSQNFGNTQGRYNPVAQVRAVTQMQPQMAQQYRQQVEQTVPRLNVAQNIQNPYYRVLGEMGQGIVNTLPNAVAGMAKLPAARNFQQGAADIASIAEAPLMLGGFGVGKQIAKQGVKQVVKQGVKQSVIQGAKTGAVYGGAFGGLEGLREGEYDSVLKQLGKAALGTGTGVVAGGILGGVLSGGGALLKKYIFKSPTIEKQLRDAAGKWTAGQKPIKPKGMAQAAWNFQLKFNAKHGRNPYTPVYVSDLSKELPQAGLSVKYTNKPLAEEARVSGKSIIDEIKSGFAGGRQARATAEQEAKGSFGQRIRTEALDRLTPVYDFVKKAGKDLATEVNPYRRMRLLAAVSGKVEAYITKNVAPILKSEGKRLDDLSALWTLEREQELVGRGLIRKRTAQQIQQGILELKVKYGEEGFRTLQESSTKLRQVGDDLLNQLHEVGVIGDESFNAIRKNNQFYAPMEAVEHIVDNLERGSFGAGNSFSVASQSVIKKIGSYTGAVADPIETLIRRIPKVLALVEKNKAMQSLVGMRKQFPEVYSDLIVPLKADVTSQGMKTINLFEGGKNVSYAVPEVVANAIKGLDAETANILVSLGSIQAKMLRAGATGLNIGFIPVNIVRDFQDALTTELTEKGAKAMFRFISSYPAAIFSAAKRGNLYQEWAAAGGLQSTMTEQIFKRTPKTVAQLSGKGQGIFKTVIGSPRALIEFANRVGEQSTRLARFKSGVAGGESVMEAAFKSRDISLDFAKAGNSIKVLNQIIPFLNAGIQGSEKVLRLYKNNPKAATAVTGALFGVPTVALYTHNSQFQDFKDIPESEKQTNWIIIARDRTQEEIAAGDKVVGIKIAKGFLARITTNTIESSLAFLEQKDPKAFVNSALDIAEGFSPVGLPIGKERLGHTVSTILPPWLQAGAEALSNTNMYFGSPIVSQSLQRLPATEQYRESTPSIYKNVGALTGISPLVLQNTVNTTTGGLGRQLAGLFSGDLKGATIDQITRRFSGVQGGKQADIAYETVGKEKEFTALRNKRLREAFAAGNEEEFTKLTEGMTSAQVKSVLSYADDKEASKQLTPEQRAYESLTNEEKIRMSTEKPDLRSKINFADPAYAASKLGGPNYDLSGAPKGSALSSYADELRKKNQEAMIETQVEISGKGQEYEGKYYYINENGNAASIQLDRPIYEPKLSGNAELDKLELSEQASSYTSKISDIQKLYQLDQLTADQANTLIVDLKAKQAAVKAKSAAPKKAKKVKIPKVKALKFPKYKPTKVKVVKPKQIKVYKVSGGKKLSTSGMPKVGRLPLKLKQQKTVQVRRQLT